MPVSYSFLLSGTLACNSNHLGLPKLFFLRYLFIIYLFIFRQRGREREEERNISVWLASHVLPTRDLACNPGMCPDWESELMILQFAGSFR